MTGASGAGAAAADRGTGRAYEEGAPAGLERLARHRGDSADELGDRAVLVAVHEIEHDVGHFPRAHETAAGILRSVAHRLRGFEIAVRPAEDEPWPVNVQQSSRTVHAFNLNASAVLAIDYRAASRTVVMRAARW